MLQKWNLGINIINEHNIFVPIVRHRLLVSLAKPLETMDVSRLACR